MALPPPQPEDEQGVVKRWPSRLWVDPSSARGVIWLMLDDCKGNPCRPPLPSSLWRFVARFLRFPAPLQMVYLFGGRQRGRDGTEECLNSAEVFDWWYGDWLPIPPMSTARVGAAAAVLGHLVVVAGGYDARATKPLCSVEAYDAEEGRWRMLPPMPTRRYGLVLAGLEGCIYAIGGDDGHHVCAANEFYELGADAWCQAAPLPRPLAGGKAEPYGGKIYYAGGCDQYENLSSTIFAYDPILDSWSHACGPSADTRLSLRLGRTSFAMTLVDDASGCGADNARLVVTGGVSEGPDEFFLSDTELLPLGGYNDPIATGGAGSSRVGSRVGSSSSISAMANTARRVGSSNSISTMTSNMGRRIGSTTSIATMTSNSARRIGSTTSIATMATMASSTGHIGPAEVPPMPQPRSGCRSCVLWPLPWQDFLPWSPIESEPGKAELADPSGRLPAEIDDTGEVRNGALPFVVILGGETPSREGNLVMRPCVEPVTLDLATGTWHPNATVGRDERPQDESVVAHAGEGIGLGAGEYRHFLESVSRLRTRRVAFAIALARGLPRVTPAPRVTAHGG